MFNIPCIVFSGGRSSRMKEDKSLLPFAGFNTITEFQLSKLQKLFTTVYISCKNKDKFDFQANFIEDIKTDNIYAPTIGFVSAFQALGVESFFAISVDAPFVSGVEIGKIIESDSPDADATIAITEFGIQPMCGIYHRSLEDKFNTMLNDNNHKLGYLLKKSNTQYVMFKDEKVFLNLNHPHEYREALRLFTDEEYRNLEDIKVDEF